MQSMGERIIEVFETHPPLDLVNTNKIHNLDSVLIIEDDFSLVHLLTQILQQRNSQVLIDWATSGEEAEHYLKRRHLLSLKDEFTKHYDLVIADIFLDGEITGIDIWRQCKLKFPEVPILVTSSLSESRFFSYIKGERHSPAYLKKPFSAHHCLQVIDSFF